MLVVAGIRPLILIAFAAINWLTTAKRIVCRLVLPARGGLPWLPVLDPGLLARHAGVSIGAQPR